MLFAAKKNNLSFFSPIVMIGMEVESNKKSSVLLLKRHQTLDLKYIYTNFIMMRLV